MIVDNIQQLSDLKGKSVFLYPIYKDGRLHKHNNPIIGFVVIDTSSGESYTISNNHPDGIFHTSDLSFLKDCVVYCYDIIAFKYQGYDTSNYIDVKMQYYLYTNQGYDMETPSIISFYTRQYQNCYRIGELVPLYKHEEIAKSVFADSFVEQEQPGLSFYQTELIDVFYTMERNGLRINPDLFEKRFGQTTSREGEYCYTEYNFYTTTGRPSNRFGGINFAALNKEDGTRECFISNRGTLVEIDFNAYHPRLIASIVGYDFGNDNVYEHLAQYYNESPEKAKELTFRQLYGGIQKQYMHIPFFKMTHNLAQDLWRQANEVGYIESPVSGRRLHLSNHTDMNPNVLFNYFVQMYETENNVILLHSLFKILDPRIVPVLYTYDSILFDTPEELCESLQKALHEVIPTLFPFKVKVGKNYKDLR